MKLCMEDKYMLIVFKSSIKYILTSCSCPRNMIQEPFLVEQFMDKYETSTQFNLGETCCYSLSLNELSALSGSEPPYKEIANQRLTYSWIKGSDRLRNLVCDLYNEPTCSSENVLVTNGAIGANFLTMYGLVGKGDHVIVVDPTYQQLKSVARMFGADVSLVNLKPENGFLPCVEEISGLMRESTKLIVLNNPNNPTGSVMSDSLLQDIVDVARRNGSYILCDEVYRPLFHSCESNPPSIVNLYEKGISTGSMSKAFSMAGIRVGWIVSRDLAFLSACAERRDYNTISVSMVDDIIACYALAHRDAILKRNYKLCQENLAIVNSFIQSSGGAFEWVKPKAGTTAFVKVNRVKGTMAFCTQMAEHKKVLIVPGETFGAPGWLRIGYANSSSELTVGLQILKDYVLSLEK